MKNDMSDTGEMMVGKIRQTFTVRNVTDRIAVRTRFWIFGQTHESSNDILVDGKVRVAGVGHGRVDELAAWHVANINSL